MPLLPGWLALPADKAHRLARAAEAFHDTLDAEATYPLDFVAFKLTGFRRDYGDTALLFGVPLAHDLRWIIGAVTQRYPMAGDEDEVQSASAWAESLDVHVRTLRRWRDAGLRWRWIEAMGKNKPVVGHTAEAMEVFRVAHPERFAKAQRFAPLSAADRRRALGRASELAAETPGRSVSNVAEQIAGELGRAHETIRLLLLKQAQRQDQTQGASNPPFPRLVPGLSPRQRRQTLRDRRRGVSLRALGERVGKSGPTLHRWLLTHRVAVLQRLDLSHVPSPLFDRDDAAEVYLRVALPDPTGDPTGGHDEVLAGLPPRVAALIHATRRWDEATRRSALLRMNYLKHTAEVARSALPEPAQLRAADLDRIEGWVREAGDLRRRLVRGELAHLVSLLRRQASTGFDPSSSAFAALFGEGLPVLVNAIDSYNASGNRRFETYLRNRVQRALAPRVSALRDEKILEVSDDEQRRRAVRRDAPSADDLAWEPVFTELLRWVSGTPSSADHASASAQDPSA